MDRIFQHYEGEIAEFTGLRFSQLRWFINIDDDDIVLLWLKVDSEDIWYRIFIDGTYCGIDTYSDDESNNDLDDFIRVEDYSSEIRGQKVLRTSVINIVENEDIIKLIITFESCVLELSCLYDIGTCKLIFT